MPIPRKTLEAAFATMSESTLRQCAKHNGKRSWKTAPLESLRKTLSKRDGHYLCEYSEMLKLPELKSIAKVFGLTVSRKTKDAMSFAVCSYVYNYDIISRGLTFESVFENTAAPEFERDLRDWMDSRIGFHDLDEMSDGEQTLWTIRDWCLAAACHGLIVIFEHGTDEDPQQFVSALREIGATKSAKVMEKVGKQIFRGPVPSTKAERNDYLVPEIDDDEELWDGHSNRLQKINSEGVNLWDTTGEDLSELMTKYAAKNAAKFQPNR